MSSPNNFPDQGQPFSPTSYGNHAQEAANEFAITSWAKTGEAQSVECPSGQKVKVRTLEMEDIIELNLLNELDTFSGFFDDEETKKEDENKTDLDFLKSLGKDGKFKRFVETLDKVIIAGAIEPQIIQKVDPSQVQAAFEAGCVPVNKIPMPDKMAIFSVAFQGLGDMGDFRQGQDEGLATVEAEPSAQVSPL